jgi:hypothetical protein
VILNRLDATNILDSDLCGLALALAKDRAQSSTTPSRTTTLKSLGDHALWLNSDMICSRIVTSVAGVAGKSPATLASACKRIRSAHDPDDASLPHDR